VAVAVPILLTIYGQIMIKLRVLQAGAMGAGLDERAIFLTKISLDPWVLSGLFGAFYPHVPRAASADAA
jgi:hypothetical protein